jgi:hypothetical protein
MLIEIAGPTSRTGIPFGTLFVALAGVLAIGGTAIIVQGITVVAFFVSLAPLIAADIWNTQPAVTRFLVFAFNAVIEELAKVAIVLFFVAAFLTVAAIEIVTIGIVDTGILA